MAVVFLILVLAAAAAMLALGVMVFDSHKGDAASRGLAQFFALAAASSLWLLLGGALLICRARSGFPGSDGRIVLMLYVVAAAGQFAALTILGDLESGDRFESLLRLAVVVSPGPVILYCLWNFFPGLRALIPAGTANAAAGLSLIAVSAIPWLVMAPSFSASAKRSEERQAAFAEVRAQDQKLAAEVRALPADALLAAFLTFTDVPPGKESDGRAAAIERMRTLPRLREQAVELLNNRDMRILRDLRDLGLEMTPDLCEAGRKCARQVVEQFKPPASAPEFDTIETRLSAYSQSIAWMLKNGCDCKTEIAALEQTVRLYPFSYPRKWFVDNLLEMQGKPREP